MQISPRRSVILLWITSLLYLSTFCYFTWRKLVFFGYDNLDLAIFNNSLFNFAQGHNLQNFIHPPMYWADHFSPILLLIAPFYYLWQQPLFLLWIQVLILTITVWPLYKIARLKLSPAISALICFLWLVNPLMHNLTLFEFSLVPLALFFLLWSYYWYERKKILWWFIFGLLALSCREDITLVIIFFSVIAWLDKRTWKWKVFPLLLTGSWFLIAQWGIKFYSAIGAYKFTVFYAWIATSSVPTVLGHFFSYGNIILFLGLLFPLLFIPLLQPRYWLFLLAPLGSLLLTENGGGALVVKTHYAGLLLWPLFLGLIAVLANPKQQKLLTRLLPETKFLLPILILASVYASLTYGSIIPLVTSQQNTERQNNYQKIISSLPPQSAVATTYSFLTNLSSRNKLQILPYAYAGKGQFALTDYQLDPEIGFLAIDWQEMLYAQAHYPSRYPDLVDQKSMQTNLQQLLAQFEPIEQSGNVMLLQKKQNPTALITTQSYAGLDPIMTGEVMPNNPFVLNLSISLPATTTSYFITTEHNHVQQLWPLGYGLYDTQLSQTITMPITIGSPTATTITLSSWHQGALHLSPTNSLAIEFDQAKIVQQINRSKQP